MPKPSALVLLGSIGVIGCSGAPFTFVGDVQNGDANVLPEINVAMGDISVDVPGDASDDRAEDGASITPKGDAHAEDASSETKDVVDGSAVADARREGSVAEGSTPSDTGAAVEADSDAAIGSEACTPPASFTFGCGPPIYVNAPSQYCVLNQIPNTAQAMTNPCACEYDCACLVASGARLCPGGESYQSCSIGTTGGMVVVCK